MAASRLMGLIGINLYYQRRTSLHGTYQLNTAQLFTTQGLPMFTTKPELSADIDAAASVLELLSVGQTATYEQFSKAIGRNILKSMYVLNSARARVEREQKCLFEAVRGVGLKRMAAEDTVKIGSQAVRKIRRSARRSLARIDTVGHNSLSGSDATRLIAMRSQLGAIAYLAETAQTEKIAKAEPKQTLPLALTLAAISGEKK
jgi:hypothetical protein